MAQAIPFLHFYSNDEYEAGAVNWKITQSPEGIMYFANNEGVLEFDGSHWQTYALPNKTNVRSVTYAGKRLYAGGQSEFGYFERDASGQLNYHSLLGNLPEPFRTFEDVWDIYVLDEKVLFRASQKIHVLGEDRKQSKVWDDQSYLALEQLDQKIYTQTGSQVQVYEEGKWVNTDTTIPSLLTGVLTIGDVTTFVTQKDGLFLEGNKPLPKAFSSINALLKQHQCFDVVRRPNGDYIFTTAYTGIIISSKDGVIKNAISKKEGLGNNKVPAAFVDRNENVWLGLDNGITYLETNALFNQVFPDGDLHGTGQGLTVHNGSKYFATSNGVYQLINNENGVPNFEMVKNSTGQTWGLDVIDNQLYLSHSEGAFIIKDDMAIKLTEDYVGYWQFIKSETYKDRVYAGTYAGIKRFDKNTIGLQASSSKIDLDESSRFIEEDSNGDLWMSHPYRGVFRIENNNSSEKPVVIELGAKDGLLSSRNNHVFKIKNEIFVCAEKGIYHYDAVSKKLVVHETLNGLIGPDVKTRRLFESPNGNIWYITENDVGYLEIQSGIINNQVSKKNFPQAAKKLNRGFEKIFFVSENDVYLTATDGFLQYNPDPSFDGKEVFEIVLKNVVVNNERAKISEDEKTLLLNSEGDENLNHKNNNLAFTVSATSFLQKGSLEYQYFLDGYDDQWSNWTSIDRKEYTNLPSGKYSFQVRAKNFNNRIEEATIATFEIDAPWYKSKVVYGLGILLLGGLLYLSYSRSNKKITAIEEKADNTIQLNRLEIQRLENEKIQQELAHKNRELISATAHLLKKNETIEGLTNQLVQIKKKVQDEESNTQIERLIRMLKTDSTKDKDWNQFMMHFNDLNRDFFIRLKNEYPALTPKDLKLCAYLKMNLSSKEIATLLNVSVRGVEASRYRLRKKMQLDSAKNITELMLEY